MAAPGPVLPRAAHVPHSPRKAWQPVKAPKKAPEKVVSKTVPGSKKTKLIRTARTAVLTSTDDIDCGLLAPILQHNNYQIIFLESTQARVDWINNAGSYTVLKYNEQGAQVDSVVIGNCRAIHHSGQRAEAIRAISEADIVTCTLPPAQFDILTIDLALGINSRVLHYASRPLMVITCHQGDGYARILLQRLDESFSEHTRTFLRQKVRFTDSTYDVMFTQRAMSNPPNVGIESSPRWYIEAPPLGPYRPVLDLASFEESIKFYIKRNSFIFVTGLVMTAYFAFSRNLRYLHSAIHNRSTAQIVRRALFQASALLGGYDNLYGSTIRGRFEYVDGLIRRLGNPALQTLALSIAINPISKLRTQGILIRPAYQLAHRGLGYDALLEGIAMALRFQRVHHDPESDELHDQLRRLSASQVGHWIMRSIDVPNPLFPGFVEVIAKVQREMQVPEAIIEGTGAPGGVADPPVPAEEPVWGGVRGTEGDAVHGGIRGDEGDVVQGGIRGDEGGRHAPRGGRNVRGVIRGP